MLLSLLLTFISHSNVTSNLNFINIINSFTVIFIFIIFIKDIIRSQHIVIVRGRNFNILGVIFTFIFTAVFRFFIFHLIFLI